MKNKIVNIAALVSALFGLVTIFAGGSVILDLFGMREKEGNYVLFVVWVNFICGFLYVFSAYGFYQKRKWTISLLLISILILILAFIVLVIWIIDDNPYEMKTIAAMSFRTLFTIGLFLIAKKYCTIPLVRKSF